MTQEPERFTPPPQGSQPPGNSGFQPGNQPVQPGYQPVQPGYQPAPPVQPGYQPAPPVQPGYDAPPVPAGPAGKIRGIGTSILLAIVTLGIYTYVWTWKTHEEIKRHSGEGVGGPLGFVIYFIVSPVTWFLLPYEVDNMVKRGGQHSRVSALWGLWILLPIIGAFVWFIRVQGQLNDYWRSRGAVG